MYIELSSAQNDALLASKFDRPKPRNTSMSEVFGPFDLRGESVFWFYNGINRTWSVERKLRDDDIVLAPMKKEAFRNKVEPLLIELDDLPRPAYPWSADDGYEKPWFRYKDWEFRWIFIKALLRWELQVGRNYSK